MNIYVCALQDLESANDVLTISAFVQIVSIFVVEERGMVRLLAEWTLGHLVRSTTHF
jgi:hypothetical protein